MNNTVVISAVLIIMIFVTIIWGSLRRARTATKQEKEREKEEKKLIKKKECEEEKEDRTYDRVINCPYCKGNGKVYVWREWRKNDDSSLMQYSLASSQEYQNYLNSRENRHQNEVWDSDLREGECPYCDGQGIAFAHYSRSEARQEKCSRCNGSGKLAIKAKQDIGMGEIQLDCDLCFGAGMVKIPEKEWIHIKTIARLKKEGDQFDGWRDTAPIISKIEINNDNRAFYSKSRARFQ